MTALDEAWDELERDALASDGRITDSDVRDAIARNRPKIEALLWHPHDAWDCSLCRAETLENLNVTKRAST